MEFSMRLTREDWVTYNKYIQKMKRNEIKGVRNNPKPLIFACVMAVVLFFIMMNSHGWHWPTALILIVIFVMFIGMLFMNTKKLQETFMPNEKGSFLSLHNFRIDEDGIHSWGDLYESRHDWQAVLSIERDMGLIMIFLDTVLAIVFAENQLESPEAFIVEIKRLRALHPPPL